MNNNIKLIKEYNNNIEDFKSQIEQLKKAINEQYSNLTTAKKNLFADEINGKTFKIRKTPRSKNFYGLEFKVSINIYDNSFTGTVTILDPSLKRYWRNNLGDMAMDSDCYIISKFVNVSKVEGETYVSKETHVEDFTIEEIAEAYLDKRLVLVK